MAANIVGDAYVVVRAITSSVEGDIRKAFDGADKEGERAGDNVSKGFKKGFNKGNQKGFNLFTPNFLAQADAARSKFTSLTRLGYFLAPAITAVAGAIGVVGTFLISLVGIIGASAGPALIVLAGAFTALAQAAITAKLAFAGVGKAISAGNKAAKSSIADKKAEERLAKALEKAERQLAETYKRAAASEASARRNLTDANIAYTESLAKAREELQQLAFDSEDASINEQKAAIDLEKARETLARVSDLPPNSRARKEAELAFAEADLNYRRAIDANNDLKKQEADNAALGPDLEAQAKGQKEVVRAKRDEADAQADLTTLINDNIKAILEATEARNEAAEAKANFAKESADANAYADALEGLSKEAQEFVKYIVSIQDEFKALKEAAGKELFPQLETAIDNLVKNLFPTLKPLLTETGDILGKIAVKISKTITSAENLKRLESIWKTNNKFLLNLGTATDNLYETFLILLSAAKPLIDEFGQWLVTITNSWKETRIANEESGKLSETFKTAKGILKDLGTIFGNTFGGIGKLVSANVGPGSGGQILLDYLKDVTEKFKNLETIDGKPLKEFFAGAAENAKGLLGLLGNILGGFLELADDPELGVFFGQLNTVTDIFQRIAKDLAGSLPAFGNFLIQFSLLFEKVTEGGSITIFFDTLSNALERLNKFLESDLGQKILDISAQVLPLLAAFGLIIKVVSFFGKVIIGSLMAIITPALFIFNKLLLIGNSIRNVFVLIQFATGLATAPLLLIIAAVVAFVAILVGAYQNSENLRNAIKDMIDFLRDVALVIFGEIKEAIADAFPSGSLDTFKEAAGNVFKYIKDALKIVGDVLAVTIIPILKSAGSILLNTVGGAIKGVIYILAGLKSAFEAVYNFFKGIFKLFTGDFDGAGESFKKAFKSAFDYIRNLFKGLISIFAGPINGVIDAINDSFGSIKIKLPDWIPGKLGGKEFSIPKIPRISVAGLAEGGIVSPSRNGTFARIAEAGRPERIEPLDPQGLSVRDRSIITQLAKEAGIGNQVNITVNPSEGMDERELAAIVARQISYSLRMGA